MTTTASQFESVQSGDEEESTSSPESETSRDSENEGAPTPKLPPINVRKDIDVSKPNNGAKKNTLSGFTLVNETRRELLEELDSYRSGRESTPTDLTRRPHFLRPLSQQQRQSLNQLEHEEQLRQELQHQLLQLHKTQEEREAMQYRYIMHSLRQDEDFDALQYQELHERLQEQSSLSTQEQEQLFRRQLEEHLQAQQEQEDEKEQEEYASEQEQSKTEDRKKSPIEHPRSASESAMRPPSKSKDGRQRRRRPQTRLSRSTTPNLVSADGDMENAATEGGEGCGNILDQFM